MTSLKLTREEFEQVEEATSKANPDNPWVMIEEGEWTQDCKYQFLEGITYHIESDKYYKYELSRSGSPFSEWYYSHQDSGYVELVEVKKVEKKVITIDWEEV